ncbi:MAG: copper resistance protein CopC [Patescibacteria group bacterium]
MNKIILLFFGFLFSAVPFFAEAHATPVRFAPAAGARLTTAPEELSITFSEKVESGASSIFVYPRGVEKSTELVSRVDGAEPRELVAPFPFEEEGAYTISWEVVSRDDGHFTKGAYSLLVGTAATSSGAYLGSGFEIVHSSTRLEAFTLWLELVGQAMLVALLGFILLGIWKKEDFFSTIPRERVRRFVYVAVALVLAGTVAYLVLKTRDLSLLSSGTFLDNARIFAATAAGMSSIVRGVLALMFLALFAGVSRDLLMQKRSPRILILALLVLAMAFLRAHISHAAASEIYPAFSIVVNWVHLLFKDLWVGGVIAYLFLFHRSTQKKGAYVAFSKLALISLLVGGTTGTYIIWLHLKGFEHIAGTDWGVLFLQLSLVAGALFFFRAYGQIVTLPRMLGAVGEAIISFFDRETDNYILALEFFTGLFVLYLTSILIITTPPLHARSAYYEKIVSSGVELTLSADPYEDGQVLLRLVPKSGVVLMGEPTVLLQNREEGIGPILVALEKRSENRYVFPEVSFTPGGHWFAFVSQSQKDGYDATAQFALNAPRDFMRLPSHFAHNGGLFEGVLLVAIAGILLVFTVARKHLLFVEGLPRESVLLPDLTARHLFRSLLGVGIFAGLVFIVGFLVADTPFHRSCEKNRHYWHVAAPMRAGVAINSRAVYGCMVGEGISTYHFADQSEYEYFLSAPRPQSSVRVDGAIPGAPSQILIRFQGADKNPISGLEISHEKTLHVSVIAEDGVSFAHLHSEDAPTKEGEYTLSYEFPRSGRYLIGYSYLHHGTPYVDHYPVQIGEDRRALSHESQTVVRATGGVEVELDHGELIAGKKSHIKFALAREGAPLFNLEPYLGAAAHITIASEEFDQFIHTHGTPSPSLYQRMFGGGSHHGGDLPKLFGPSVETDLVFPEPGFYQLYAEFQSKGEIVVAPFVVEVK